LKNFLLLNIFINGHLSIDDTNIPSLFLSNTKYISKKGLTEKCQKCLYYYFKNKYILVKIQKNGDIPQKKPKVNWKSEQKIKFLIKK